MKHKESVNKFLTEQFLKESYHVARHNCDNGNPCRFMCDGETCTDNDRQNLFTPEGFILLWKKAQKQEWWPKFIQEQHQKTFHKWHSEHLWLAPFIDPLTFPVLLAEYLGWKEE